MFIRMSDPKIPFFGKQPCEMASLDVLIFSGLRLMYGSKIFNKCSVWTEPMELRPADVHFGDITRDPLFGHFQGITT